MIMTDITVLTETELRNCVGLDLEIIDALAEGFQTLSAGKAVMPPIMRLDVEEHHGEVDVKTAYVPGVDSFAIKLATGFFNNPARGLPTASGMMNLFDSATGQVKAVLLDNGYLTDVRTAAAGGLAARTLAKDNIDTVTIVGAGGQARWQLEALSLVRKFSEITIWARDMDKASAFAANAGEQYDADVRVVADLQEAVSNADVIITTTPASEPLVQKGWVKPGAHITAMGSDAEHKCEISPELIASADVYAADSAAQCARLGELRSAIEKGLVSADQPKAELGQILAGEAPGRTSDEQITIADLTGTGMQDTVMARMAYAKAVSASKGTVVST